MEKQINPQQNFFEPELETLVKPDHPYRSLLEKIDFEGLTRSLSHLLNRKYGRPGYNLTSSFKALILQWMEDLSDRELERYLQENNAAKFFCDFRLFDKVPDHTYFCGFRKKIGTERLAKLFNKLGKKLREKGLIAEVFTFVDASKMVSKVSLWEERDLAIAAGEEKLNNQNLEKHAADKDARLGCKGKDKYWYGYKRNLAACTKNGLITKIAVTKANVTDAKALKNICPRQGMVIADKGYCTKEAAQIMKARNCHNGAIKKNNMKGKNRDKDRFISKLRMPFEGIFSKMNNRCRYRTLAKNQFQAFMQALVHNFKRLIKIDSPPLIFEQQG